MASSNTSLISFHYLFESFPFSRRKDLKNFLIKQCRKEGKKIESLNFIFCSDAYLLQLNQSHLAHDTLTDIITFELSPKNAPLVSDIYISIERVKENARTYQVPFKTELHRVIFHGVLHLCGYKDKKPSEKKEMRSREDDWLRIYFK